MGAHRLVRPRLIVEDSKEPTSGAPSDPASQSAGDVERYVYTYSNSNPPPLVRLAGRTAETRRDFHEQHQPRQRPHQRRSGAPQQA